MWVGPVHWESKGDLWEAMRAFAGRSGDIIYKEQATLTCVISCSPSNSLIKVDTGILIVLVRRQRLKEVSSIAANWQGQGLKPGPWSLLETEDWACVVIVTMNYPEVTS